ncbi:MAG: crotonase/enoyl-CoA hydratase family protein [Paracoccaceae bacterium]
MSAPLELTVSGPVAELRLERPDKKNALNFELLEALAAAGQELKARRNIRAVILHGAGGVFSSGIDLELLQGVLGRMDEIRRQMLNPPAGEAANLFQKPVTVWAELDKPVIAAIEGVCFGAGMQLALGADFRIAAPAARLSIMEAKWGLVPDMGITRSLPRLMRADQAKELIMTGRILDAPEALSLGLLTRVCDDPLAAARALAADLAGRSPEAVAASKRLVEAAWATPEALALEAELQAGLMGSPNQMEAVMAVLQNRAPDFK